MELRVLIVVFTGQSLLTLPFRYPVLMSPDVKWPLGAQAQGLLRQKHDQELLTDELEKGLGCEVLADVHEGEVEGQVNWAGEQMDMV